MNTQLIIGGVVAFILGIVFLAGIYITHDPNAAFILFPAAVVGIVLGIGFIIVGFFLCR